MVIIKCHRCERQYKFISLNNGEAAKVIREIGWITTKNHWLCNQCQGKNAVRKEIRKEAKTKPVEKTPARIVTIGKRKRKYDRVSRPAANAA